MKDNRIGIFNRINKEEITMFDLKPVRHSDEIMARDPFKELEEFEKRFFGRPFGLIDNQAIAGFKTDIRDAGDAYVLEADLPGVDKNDISLDVSGNVLTIKAQRDIKKEHKDKKGEYVRCERSYGSYMRQFDITGVDVDNIKCKYESGVLTINMPKIKEESTKKLEIE